MSNRDYGDEKIIRPDPGGPGTGISSYTVQEQELDQELELEGIRDQYVTGPEAAELAGVSKVTMSKWSRDGTIVARRKGPYYRVERASLEALIKQRESGLVRVRSKNKEELPARPPALSEQERAEYAREGFSFRECTECRTVWPYIPLEGKKKPETEQEKRSKLFWHESGGTPYSEGWHTICKFCRRDLENSRKQDNPSHSNGQPQLRPRKEYVRSHPFPLSPVAAASAGSNNGSRSRRKMNLMVQTFPLLPAEIEQVVSQLQDNPGKKILDWRIMPPIRLGKRKVLILLNGEESFDFEQASAVVAPEQQVVMSALPGPIQGWFAYEGTELPSLAG